MVEDVLLNTNSECMHLASSKVIRCLFAAGFHRLLHETKERRRINFTLAVHFVAAAHFIHVVKLLIMLPTLIYTVTSMALDTGMAMDLKTGIIFLQFLLGTTYLVVFEKKINIQLGNG